MLGKFVFRGFFRLWISVEMRLQKFRFSPSIKLLLLSSVWEMGKIWFRATNKIPFLYLLFFDEMLPVLFHNNILKIIWLISSLLLINY